MQQINLWKRILTMVLVTGMFLTAFGFSRRTVRAAGFVVSQGGILEILERQKTAIVGAWDAPDNTGFQALFNFYADGTLLVSDEDPTSTNGHGVWRHLGGTQFAFTYVQHKKAGQLSQGTTTVWGKITMDTTGKQFGGPLHFEIADADGTVTDSDTMQSLNLTVTGKRVQLRL
ncbi:MAG TPA: hypothetical protein PLD20_09820 [Blastocatellia bacterium]|nr:hypothetical protein [Blastocatellia bacterium]HMV82009.1 hypothetical protein [Blastocatellia bacterium]HMX28708.1 hypothetical protein [Blastocatellia bacterium]HMY72124.1 hypothetical protein [Blastocatellia bacterium]HMZ18217.1 hypothetical protein [Blastocatellia bacterium]